MRSVISLLLATLSLPVFCQKQFVDSLFITTSDSVRLFVKRSGTGYPVAFIHGGPGSNSLYFEKEGGDVFSRIVQIIYIDQRGCGRSDSAMNDDYSLTRVVKDFDEVRQRLVINNGWSWRTHLEGYLPLNMLLIIPQPLGQWFILIAQ
jgi:proline iminopeptidase